MLNQIATMSDEHPRIWRVCELPFCSWCSLKVDGQAKNA